MLDLHSNTKLYQSATVKVPIRSGMALVITMTFLIMAAMITIAILSTVVLHPRILKAKLAYRHNQRLAEDAVNYAILNINTIIKNHQASSLPRFPTIFTRLNVESYPQENAAYGWSTETVKYGYIISSFIAMDLPSRMRYDVYLIHGYACIDSSPSTVGCTNKKFLANSIRYYEKVFTDVGESNCLCGP